MFYVSYHAATNALVGVSMDTPPAIDGVVTEGHEGNPPDLLTHYWNPSILSFVARENATLTRLAFLRLFTGPERIAARELAKTDPIVTDFLQMVDLAENITLSDPDTTMALQYLAMKGVIAPERVVEILAG